MPALDIKDAASRLRTAEDGSITNKRVEQYVLLRAEEVIPPTTAWKVIWPSKGAPNGGYMAKILAHPVFKARLEFLMDEKQELASRNDIWADLEWQARQVYRRGAALNDSNMMLSGMAMLHKIAVRKDPKPAPAPAAPEEKRPVGAPAAEVPEEAPKDELVNRRLLEI